MGEEKGLGRRWVVGEGTGKRRDVGVGGWGRRGRGCASDKKCATMDHEGPSMSVIIYSDHQLTLFLMFTSIPGVERRRSTQVV